MDRITLLLRPAIWPLAAAIMSLAILGIAHGFQAAGYEPCLLCLKQREPYWLAAGAGIAGGLALMRWRMDAPARMLCLLLAGLFLWGLGLAVYHAGAEWKYWPGPAACGGTTGLGDLNAGNLLESLSAPQRVVRCDEPAWVFLGLSMAAWNALLNLGLAGMSLLAATLPARAARDKIA